MIHVDGKNPDQTIIIIGSERIIVFPGDIVQIDSVTATGTFEEIRDRLIVEVFGNAYQAA